MNAIELMVNEHENISRMLVVLRKACYRVLKGEEVNFDDFNDMVDFIRTYADGHHHNKEEIFLFNRMAENLGAAGEKVIKHGMLVEHDLGRMYVGNLSEALKKLKEGDEEAKLDIIANAISYTDLLTRHIEKENSVVYKFAERSLEKSLLDTINDECKAYEKKHGNTRVKKLEALEKLEKRYL